jgi:hypothetical protein
MTTKFKFEAKDAAGKVVKVSVSANSQADAVADLRKRNLQPMEVTKTGGWMARNAWKYGWLMSYPKGKLRSATSQLSTMLSAGIRCSKRSRSSPTRPRARALPTPRPRRQRHPVRLGFKSLEPHKRSSLTST